MTGSALAGWPNAHKSMPNSVFPGVFIADFEIGQCYYSAIN